MRIGIGSVLRLGGGAAAAIALAGFVAMAQPRADGATTVTPALALNQAASVMTQKNDPGRTGANLNETALAPAGISNSKIGRLTTRQVVGSILAQPLYLSGADMGPGIGIRNVVLVATSGNHVYAFDADNIAPDPAGLLWHNQSLGTTNKPSGQCGETRWPIGITSTPVFDPATGALFVVTRTTNGCTDSSPACDTTARYLLRKLDVQTGNLLTSAEIRTISPVVPAGGGAAVSFNPQVQLNRPGLLLMNGAVYVGFGTLNCDQGDFHGWVFGYRTSDLGQQAAFVDSPSGGLSGIWQSGQGLAGDPAANAIYLFTGNGTSAAPFGDSILKLTVGGTGALSLAASHVPLPERPNLDCSDTDLGAGAPLLLPSGMMIGGGKQGVFYLVSQSNLVQQRSFQATFDTWHQQSAANPSVCADAAAPACPGVNGVLEQLGCFIPTSSYQFGESLAPNIHGGPAFWANGADNGFVYVASEKDYLKAFQYRPSIHDVVCGAGSTSGNCLPAMTSQTIRAPNGMPGGFLSISANGPSNGVVWASIEKKHGQWTDTPGVVVASDAATLKELWRDNADVPFTKFMPVTVAGGKIFRASMAPFTEDPGSLGELIVYGALPATTWGATTVGGPGAEFVADSRGRLFALTPDRQAVMAYMGWGGNWIQIGGPAAHLYAGGPFLFATTPGTGAILRWDDPLWTQVGGAGSTFAVDDRGTLYGLTPDQQAVFQYTGQGQNWTQVGGPAASLWAGGFYLFATSPTGDVFRFGPEAPRDVGGADQWVWRQAGTPGAAFAADGTGRLYGITPDGQALNAYNGWDLSWRNIGGAATAITGGGQRLFRIAAGVVSVFDEGPSTSWINTGIAASQVVARGDLALAIDPSTGNVRRLAANPAPPTTRPWQRVQIGGPGAQFAVDSIGNIYGLTPNLGAVFKYMGVFDTDDGLRLAWNQVTGGASSILAGGTRLYSVDPATGNIRRHDGTLTPTTIGNPGAQFVVDDFGTIYALTPDRQAVFQYSGSGMAWTQIGGPAAALLAGGTRLYATSPTTGNILRYNGTPNSWTQVGGPGAQFAVDGDGTLYGLTSDRQAVNRLDATGWTTIGGPASAIFAGGGTFVALDPPGTNLYHFDPALGGWDFVGSNLTPVVRAGVVLGVDRATGNVYRYWRP